MGHDLFISHSAKDKKIADAVCMALEADGVRCWIAPRDIDPGQDWSAAIIEGLESAKVMVLIFSQNSNQSDQVKREVERAIAKGLTIIPLRLEDVPMNKSLEYFLSRTLWMDALTPPLENHLRQLALKVKALLPAPPAPPLIAGSGEERSIRPLVGGKTGNVASAKNTFDLRFNVRSVGCAISLAICALLAVVILPNLPTLVHQPGGNHEVFASTAFTNTIGMKFAAIPAGKFQMGSPEQEGYHGDDETRHVVTLTRGFLMGATLVTKGQFREFIAATTTEGSAYKTDAEAEGFGIELSGTQFVNVSGASWQAPGFPQDDDHPVVEVSWNDATAFCAWLSRKEGRHYRLPTEAEWEYAARAGETTAYPWGNNPDSGQGRANCYDQTAKQRFPNPNWVPFTWSDGYVFTSPVQAFPPNAFSLHDTIGNALEWVADWYGTYPASAVIDPRGPSPDAATPVDTDQMHYRGPAHVMRGGSWNFDSRGCRFAARAKGSPNDRDNNVGFRILLDQG